MGLFSREKKEQEALNATGSFSVLAVANDEGVLRPIFNSLVKFQYRAKIVHDINHFIDSLEEMQPDILLISLNLQNTDVMKVISILQHHGYPCVAFGEDENEETYLKLLGTAIHHTLLPPMTFEAFMERVEFIAMEHDLRPSGQAPEKTGWGKIITILKQEVLDLGQVIVQEKPLEPEVSRDSLTPVDEADLAVGRHLDIDIFIAMPLNHKCILYLRKGSVVLKENLERLARLEKSRILKRKAA